MKRFVVYTLARPSGRIFYVGKGVLRRPQQHITEARMGECICRKCKIIREILKTGREVKIDYVFETDDEREAYNKETELIEQLSKTVHLCNKKQNRNYKHGPPPPKYFDEMSASEVEEYLAILDISKAQRARIKNEWIQIRLGQLKRDLLRYRLEGKRDRVAAIRMEIEALSASIGQVRQNELDI